MRDRWKTVRRVWSATAITAVIAFVAWSVLATRGLGVDPALLESSARVAVIVERGAIRFQPALRVSAGLVFFPGALVDPRVYAPLAHAIAEKGFPVAIVRTTLWNALLGLDQGAMQGRALAVIAADQRTHWSVGGHAQGALLAARLADTNANWIHGLVLIGSTAPRDIDLADLALPVLKVFATNDGIAPPDRVRESAARLPEATAWVEIAGGNHAQFGWYGPQLGDHAATISRSEQQRRTRDALVAFLAAIPD